MTAAANADAGAARATTADLARASLLGNLAVVGAVVAFASGTIGIKLIGVSALTISVWRMLVALPVVHLIRRGSGQRFGRRELVATAPGGIAFGLHLLCYFAALQFTSVGTVTFVAALQPVLVMLVAPRLFGEQRSGRLMAWAVVGIAGVGLVVVGSAATGADTLLGDVLAVVNLFLWTAYFLVSKRTRASLPTATYQAGLTTWAALVAIPAGLVFSPDLWAIHGSGWLWLVWIALGPGILGHAMLNWSHDSVDATTSSLILLAMPALATALAVVVLHEPWTWIGIAGGALVLASTGAVALRRPAVAEALDE